MRNTIYIVLYYKFINSPDIYGLLQLNILRALPLAPLRCGLSIG
jgi:hypothetical protein